MKRYLKSASSLHMHLYTYAHGLEYRCTNMYTHTHTVRAFELFVDMFPKEIWESKFFLSYLNYKVDRYAILVIFSMMCWPQPPLWD